METCVLVYVLEEVGVLVGITDVHHLPYGGEETIIPEKKPCKMAKSGRKIICKLSTPSERAHFELLIATFISEIESSQLKLWPQK